MIERVRTLYGARPLHLVAVIASFALAGLALNHFVRSGPLSSIALWFAGAIVAHDLLLFPAYTLADRAAGRALSGPRGAHPGRINYLRIPTLLSGLLLLVWFPLILRLGDTRFHAASGLDTHAYLGRWLAISAALFVISGVWFAVAELRGGSVRSDE